MENIISVQKAAKMLEESNKEITKDIKYILNWFNINIEIKDALRKNN